MKAFRAEFSASLLLFAAFLAGGCAASRPAATTTSKSPTASTPRCESGTLGIETIPISRTLRKELALPDRFQGAVVVEVFPGGPAAKAGVQPHDIIEQVDSTRIGSDCDFVNTAHSRPCGPVRVVLRRAGAAVEATLVPVDQDSFLDEACRNGIARACFRRAWGFWTRNQGIDRQHALELYQAACQSGSAEACAHAGLHLADQAANAKSALATLERSCELQSGAGCAHLAFLYATGKLVKKDDRRATQLYVRSCELGDGMAATTSA